VYTYYCKVYILPTFKIYVDEFSFIAHNISHPCHLNQTIMIDTQQQYINLNIRGEISIIVVQAHSGRKRDNMHINVHTLTHIYMGGGGGYF
jgi:hypothetical protein